MPMPDASASLTLLTRYVPASTGTHGSRLTSQRGVVPTHCGGVLVVFANCRAAAAPSVWTGSADSAMRVQSYSSRRCLDAMQRSFLGLHVATFPAASASV